MSKTSAIEQVHLYQEQFVQARRRKLIAALVEQQLIYLRAYASVPDARAGIGRHLSFYNA